MLGRLNDFGALWRNKILRPFKKVTMKSPPLYTELKLAILRFVFRLTFTHCTFILREYLTVTPIIECFITFNPATYYNKMFININECLLTFNPQNLKNSCTQSKNKDMIEITLKICAPELHFQVYLC